MANGIEHYDFAVAGTSPLAALLAGTLAATHKRKVCRIGCFPHPLRPQRGFDLSVGPITHPETWRLLARTVPETFRILDEAGAGKARERVDPLLVARTSAGATALQHMRVVAACHGVMVERQPISPQFADRYQFRDAVRLLGRPLNTALAQWLKAVGVMSFPPDSAVVHSYSQGSARLDLDGREARAETLVLVGDAAIARYADAGDLALHFRPVRSAAILLEPTPPIANRTILVADTGTCIHQRESGALACAGPGTPKRLGSAVSLFSRSGQRLRLVGSAEFVAQATRDGGPLVGRTGRNGPCYIAGLGTTGLFLAPALARYLAGVASQEENTYFAARAPSERGWRPGAAEFAPGASAEPAA